MKNREIRKTGLIVALITALTMLPFLGATEFYTKGEPREAIVAVTMLQAGNWLWFALYVVGSVALGLLMVAAGYHLSK